MNHRLFSIISHFSKKIILFLSEIITYPVIVFLKIHRYFSKNMGGLYIYPHFGARSFRLRLPSTIFTGLFAVILITLVSLSGLSIANIVLGIFETKTQYSHNKTQTITKNYQGLLKDYIVGHDQKETRIRNSVALLFGQKSPIGGVGGSDINDKNTQLLEDHLSKSELLTDWDNAFDAVPEKEYSAYVDEHLGNYDEMLTLIDKFEIRLSQQKKITKSIPTAWPIRSITNEQKTSKDNSNNTLSEKSENEIQSSLEENSQNIALSEESITDLESVLSLVNDDKSSKQWVVFDIYQPSSVVATSRGMVDEIIKKDDTWSVKVQHEFGFVTYYEGIEELSVKKGDLVNRLSEIGRVGISFANNETLSPKYEPKLKYQIKIARTFVNPRDFLIFNY